MKESDSASPNQKLERGDVRSSDQLSDSSENVEGGLIESDFEISLFIIDVNSRRIPISTSLRHLRQAPQY